MSSLGFPSWLTFHNPDRSRRATLANRVRDGDYLIAQLIAPRRTDWALWAAEGDQLRHVANDSGWSVIGTVTSPWQIVSWESAAAYLLARDELAAPIFMLVNAGRFDPLKRLVNRYIQENFNG